MTGRHKRRGRSHDTASESNAASERAADFDRGERLTSIDALRRRVPTIVERINAEPALALRAAANPILALEELGFALSAELKQEVALRLRFDERAIARMQLLTKTIHEIAGQAFELDDPDELDRVLFAELGLPRVAEVTQRLVIAEGTLASLHRPTDGGRSLSHALEFPWQPAGGVARRDPLRALEGKHPIIALLLEYRALQASQPPLASRELYERIARGDVSLPNFSIRARLRRVSSPKPPDA